MTEQVSRAEALRGGDSAPWLKLLEIGRCKEYEDVCDKVERSYGKLQTSDTAYGADDGEFRLFWANMQVMFPTIYSREPKPEVTPTFKDRRDLPRRAAEIMERSLVTDIKGDRLHDTLKLVREDLAMLSRGVVWVREAKRKGVTAPIAERLTRKNFRHGPAENWWQVPWVARAGWLTKEQVRSRFGAVADGMSFQMEGGGGESEERLPENHHKTMVWEIWHKAENIVVWVAEGVKTVLDAQDPWLDLEGFFPCPKPAYGTLEPRSLKPIPDLHFYQTQIDEICELTARIHALFDALRVKGFYSAGHENIGDALEAALKDMDNRAVLVPVPSLQALAGSGKIADAISWMPVEQVAATIRELIGNRKELIADVYEISGLSDIMRGSTDPNETLGAQELKSQYGSIRVSDKQDAMAELARDVIAIKAEILAEKAPFEDLLELSQVDDLPSTAEIEQQAMQMVQQGVPQQQIMAQLGEVVTAEAVAELLANQKLRPFVLDIETDSTITPDRVRDRRERMEFVTAVGGFVAQASEVVMKAPILGPVAAETLIYLASGFDVPRTLEAQLDELAEKLTALAEQPQQPDPRAMAEAQAMQRKEDREDALAAAKIRETDAKLAPPAEPVSVDPLDRAKVAQKDRELDLKQDDLAIKAASAAASLVRDEGEPND